MSTLREVSRLAFVTAFLFASLDRCARGRDEDIPRHTCTTNRQLARGAARAGFAPSSASELPSHLCCGSE